VVNQLVGEVIPTRVQLTFSQCQNYIADISSERNYTYFFWGHADVALQSSSTEQTFAEEVRICHSAAQVQSQKHMQPYEECCMRLVSPAFAQTLIKS